MDEKHILHKKLTRASGIYFLALSLLWIPAGIVQICLSSALDGASAYAAGSMSQSAITGSALFVFLLWIRKLYPRQPGTDACKILGFKAPDLIYVWYGFVIMLASYPLMGAIAELAAMLTPGSVQALTDQDLRILRDMHPAAAYALLAVIPAVFEEISCRGVIYGAARNRGLFAAVSVSASCFALLHMDPVQAAYAFAFGILLALMREFTGSVVPGIAAHMSFNALSVAAIYSDIPDGYADAEYGATNAAAYAAVLAASLFFTAFALYRMKRRAGYEFDFRPDRSARPVSIFHILGWICCAGVMILIMQ